MDEHTRDVYLLEAVTQCKFAMNALRGLNNVLPRFILAAQGQEYDLRQTLHDEIFRSIHSFLTHASNVSRLFWPAPPRRGKREDLAVYEARCAARPSISRAAALRSAIGLDIEHVLKSRKLRDHLEHFDDRLDNWAKTSRNKTYVQDLIGGESSVTGVDSEDMMRWFDPGTHEVRFRGEVYSIPELAHGIANVSKLCINVLSTGRFATAFRFIERQK